MYMTVYEAQSSQHMSVGIILIHKKERGRLKDMEDDRVKVRARTQTKVLDSKADTWLC